ncbi:MAG: hypothetical protein LUI02_01300 [Clostridiales bacterium]|nr:hypothetical protein [Clostridiales bacterium]
MDLTSSISSLTYSSAQSSVDDAAATSVTSSLSGLSSDSSEEEMKAAIKTFESYFVEQIIKETEEAMTLKDDDDEDSTMSQYKELFGDQVVQIMADEIVDDMGDTLTQQLYEQMCRNLQ